jgi:hypothetical protein
MGSGAAAQKRCRYKKTYCYAIQRWRRQAIEGGVICANGRRAEQQVATFNFVYSMPRTSSYSTNETSARFATPRHRIKVNREEANTLWASSNGHISTNILR